MHVSSANDQPCNFYQLDTIVSSGKQSMTLNQGTHAGDIIKSCRLATLRCLFWRKPNEWNEYVSLVKDTAS